MDESKYPTSGPEILTAAKGLDLDEATYKPPKYSFPIFDDALYKPTEFGKAMRDTNFAIGDFTFLSKQIRSNLITKSEKIALAAENSTKLRLVTNIMKKKLN